MNNRVLLEAAKDILKYVMITTNGVIPLTLVGASEVLKQEAQLQDAEDEYHSWGAEYHKRMMDMYYGGE
jgi:hypothetical protein